MSAPPGNIQPLLGDLKRHIVAGDRHLGLLARGQGIGTVHIRAHLPPVIKGLGNSHVITDARGFRPCRGINGGKIAVAGDTTLDLGDLDFGAVHAHIGVAYQGFADGSGQFGIIGGLRSLCGGRHNLRGRNRLTGR